MLSLYVTKSTLKIAEDDRINAHFTALRWVVPVCGEQVQYFYSSVDDLGDVHR